MAGTWRWATSGSCITTGEQNRGAQKLVLSANGMRNGLPRGWEVV